MASLIETKPLDVPHFALIYGVKTMTYNTDLWLRGRGYMLRLVVLVDGDLITHSWGLETKPTPVEPREGLPEFLIIGGQPPGGVRHSVVARTDRFREWIAAGQKGAPPFEHDPNPTRSGIPNAINAFAILPLPMPAMPIAASDLFARAAEVGKPLRKE